MKNKKIIIITIVVVIAIIVYLFWDDIKKLFSKASQVSPGSSSSTQSGGGYNTGGGANTGGGSVGNSGSGSDKKKEDPAPKAEIIVGNTVVSDMDNKKAYDDKMENVLRIYAKKDFIGVVLSKKSTGWFVVISPNGERLNLSPIGLKKL